jgi:hypothetical protein
MDSLLIGWWNCDIFGSDHQQQRYGLAFGDCTEIDCPTTHTQVYLFRFGAVQVAYELVNQSIRKWGSVIGETNCLSWGFHHWGQCRKSFHENR